MAFGILEAKRDSSPPGTSLLTGSGQEHRGSATSIVLTPAPSKSPRDPLNWSSTRKELAFLTIILGTCGTGVIGPLLVPGFPIIAAAFEITLTQVTLLNGSLVSASAKHDLEMRSDKTNSR